MKDIFDPKDSKDVHDLMKKLVPHSRATPHVECVFQEERFEGDTEFQFDDADDPENAIRGIKNMILDRLHAHWYNFTIHDTVPQVKPFLIEDNITICDVHTGRENRDLVICFLFQQGDHAVKYIWTYTDPTGFKIAFYF